MVYNISYNDLPDLPPVNFGESNEPLKHSAKASSSALYLSQRNLLTQPVLYLGSYIVRYKTAYYRLLKNAIRYADR